MRPFSAKHKIPSEKKMKLKYLTILALHTLTFPETTFQPICSQNFVLSIKISFYVHIYNTNIRCVYTHNIDLFITLKT